MTAGRGITHSERFDTMREHGGELDGIQAWIALPNEREEIDPEFTHFAAGELPARDIDGVRLRLIAGEAYGMSSPVRVHSPLFYAHAALKPGAGLQTEADYAERAAFVAHGRVQIEGELYEPGQMAVFAAAAAPAITAVEEATLMLLGGEPIGARHIWWNFVSSSGPRIEQARAQWRAGGFPLPVGDDAEFIPLPEDPPPPAEPMS